jgi:hypothetical protein
MTLDVSYWARRSPQRDYRNFDGLHVGATAMYGF